MDEKSPYDGPKIGSFEFLGVTYSYILCKDLKDQQGGGADGLFSEGDRNIYLDEDIPDEERFRDVLLHEHIELINELQRINLPHDAIDILGRNLAALGYTSPTAPEWPLKKPRKSTKKTVSKGKK